MPLNDSVSADVSRNTTLKLFLNVFEEIFILFVLFRDSTQSGTRQACCVGQYVVQVKEFEQVALPALTLVGAFAFPS